MATEAKAKKAAAKPKGKKATATKAPKTAKAARTDGSDTQNGISRPKDGTNSGKVWSIADKLSAKAGEPAKRKDVLADAEKANVNTATAATQFARWRTYHGVVRAAA